jgi:hypothetical protein
MHLFSQRGGGNFLIAGAQPAVLSFLIKKLLYSVVEIFLPSDVNPNIHLG